MQTKVNQLEGEMDRMRYKPGLVTTTQTVRPPPTPAEKYVQPRSRVNLLTHLSSTDNSFLVAHHTIKRIAQTNISE